MDCGVFGGAPVGICVFAVEAVEQKIVGALLGHEPLHKQSDWGRRHDEDKLQQSERDSKTQNKS